MLLLPFYTSISWIRLTREPSSKITIHVMAILQHLTLIHSVNDHIRMVGDGFMFREISPVTHIFNLLSAHAERLNLNTRQSQHKILHQLPILWPWRMRCKVSSAPVSTLAPTSHTSRRYPVRFPAEVINRILFKRHPSPIYFHLLVEPNSGPLQSS